MTVFDEIKTKFGNIKIIPTITGSARMGISEKFNIPFVQEVVAAAEVIKKEISSNYYAH